MATFSDNRHLISPTLKVGALVLDQASRVLLVRSCPEKEMWGIPSREAEPFKPVMLSVIRLMHDEFRVLAWPVRVLSISDELNEEFRRHNVWIVYSVSILTEMPIEKVLGTYEEAGWFSRQALPARLTSTTVDALQSL